MLKAMMLGAMLMLGCAGAAAAAPFDDLFVRSELQGSAYELALARLAEARATRPEVHAYAATLVNDHEAYGGALRELAQSKGIPVPPGMGAGNKQRLERLAGLRGAAFDAGFVREARRVNAEDMREFRREASRTADPAIRAFVTRFLEVDERHEAGARELGGRAVASRMPVIKPPPAGSRMPVISPPSDGAMPVITPPGPAAK